MRRAVLLAPALLMLAACGGESVNAEAEAAGSSAGTATTSSAAPTSEPATPYETYSAAVMARGLTPGITEDEAVSVAGNTCDNTVADMAGLVSGLQLLYTETELAESLVDRAYFIDTYCPDARVVFDAGTQSALGVVVPPA